MWPRAFSALFHSLARFLLPFHARAMRDFFFAATHITVLPSLSIEYNVTSRSLSLAHPVLFSPTSVP
jgi:hypothetical protein